MEDNLKAKVVVSVIYFKFDFDDVQEFIRKYDK